MSISMEKMLFEQQSQICQLQEQLVLQEKRINIIVSSNEQKGLARRIVINGETYYIGSAGDAHFKTVVVADGQNHIIDADGSLADITTKFNTLLSELETATILKGS